jgi:hypothetical protein
MLRTTVCSVLVLLLLVGASCVDAGAEDVLGSSRSVVNLPVNGQGVDFNGTTSGGVCDNSDEVRADEIVSLTRRHAILQIQCKKFTTTHR